MLTIKVVMLAALARSSAMRSAHHVEDVYSEADIAPGQAQNFDYQLDGEVSGL